MAKAVSKVVGKLRRKSASERNRVRRAELDRYLRGPDGERDQSLFPGGRDGGGQTWFELKDRLRTDGESAKADLKRAFHFREAYVTRLVDSLKEKYPNLRANASGSQDLESDIDITFASPGSGDDVRAAREFNRRVYEEFGQPPGRVFDVNIYIWEYGPTPDDGFGTVRAEAPSGKPLDYADVAAGGRRDDPTQHANNWQRMTDSDQDAATLMKQRRFLGAEGYAALAKSVAPDQGAATRRAYDEAEANYLVATAEKVWALADSLRLPSTPDKDSADPAVKAFLTGVKRAARELDAQLRLEKLLSDLDSARPDLVMRVTDDMYLDRMARLRTNEEEIRSMEARLASPDTLKPGDVAVLDAKVLALKVQVKKDITTNILFANEAYISEGALDHVVGTSQATRGMSTRKQKEALRKLEERLRPAQILQSVNEQLADLFKETQHQPEDHVGEGMVFVHASKYLSRMLGAAEMLTRKLGLDPHTASQQDALVEGLVDGRADTVKGETLDAMLHTLKKEVDKGLLATRKSSKGTVEDKAKVGHKEMGRRFGIKSVADFRDRLAAFTAGLNRLVRSHASLKDNLEVDTPVGQRLSAEEALRFNNRSAPPEERWQDAVQSLLLAESVNGPGWQPDARSRDALQGLRAVVTRAPVEHRDALANALVGLVEALRKDSVLEASGQFDVLLRRLKKANIVAELHADSLMGEYSRRQLDGLLRHIAKPGNAPTNIAPRGILAILGPRKAPGPHPLAVGP